MNKLQIIIKEVLEENAAGNFSGSGGSVGAFTSTQFSGDNWNTGDLRIAQGIGPVTKRTFPELMNSVGKKVRSRRKTHRRKRSKKK